MLTGETFPLTQIDKGGVDTMMRQLGGDPVVPSQLEGLFGNSARPLLEENQQLQRLFLMIGYGTADAFGLAGDEGIDAFCAGGYLYAASLAHLTPLTEIPLHDSVFEAIADTDNEEFVQKAYRTLYVEQAPIVGLIGKTERALELDKQRRKMAIVGAGALHIVTTRSMLAHAQMIADMVVQAHQRLESVVFEINHTELHDLDPQFEALNPDDSTA